MPTIDRRDKKSTGPSTVLELTVRNHPGVMSHICGLFTRRAFNLEGILCLPLGSGQKSRIWLLVRKDQKLEQMLRQAKKLQDVLDVQKHQTGRGVFARLGKIFLG